MTLEIRLKAFFFNLLAVATTFIPFLGSYLKRQYYIHEFKSMFDFWPTDQGAEILAQRKIQDLKAKIEPLGSIILSGSLAAWDLELEMDHFDTVESAIKHCQKLMKYFHFTVEA